MTMRDFDAGLRDYLAWSDREADAATSAQRVLAQAAAARRRGDVAGDRGRHRPLRSFMVGLATTAVLLGVLGGAFALRQRSTSTSAGQVCAWTPTKAPFPADLHQFAMTQLPNGDVIIAGGNHGYQISNAAWMYHWRTHTWSALASMHRPRWGAGLALWGTGFVVIAGGVTYDPSGNHISASDNFPTTAEAYDVERNVWVELPDLPAGTDYPYALTLHDGSVLVLDNEHAFRLPPGASAWSESHGPAIAFGASATELADGDVLVAGGANMDATAAAYVLHVSTMTWTGVGPMHVARSEHTATLLKDGRVLLAGGHGNPAMVFNKHTTNAAEIFDPARGTWTVAASMPDTREDHAAGLLPSGGVLVIGGMQDAHRGSTADQKTAWVYDPAADRWTVAADLPDGINPAPGPLQPHVLAVHGNEVLALGDDQQGISNTPQLGSLGAHC